MALCVSTTRWIGEIRHYFAAVVFPVNLGVGYSGY
jgi:hypothetical protein